MPDDKFDKLNKMLELMQNDTVRPQEIEKFLAMVLEFVTKSKTEFDTLSTENLQKIDECMKMMQSEYGDVLAEIDARNSQLSGQVESKVAELQKAIEKVQTMKPVDGEPGKDGINPTPESVVPLVLEKLPKPIEETGETIADKLETLKGDKRLDASAIKNLPEATQGSKGSGLRNVFHDTTLTGTGRSEDPLKVVAGSGGSGTVTSVASADGSITVTNPTTTVDLAVVKAPKLSTARTIGGVSFDGTANITVASATGGFAVSGGDLALGANNLTMTGSLGATGARLTKGWFTDLQVTNAIAGSITGNAATVTTNANLTGPIISSGNATSIASQTGTGTKFVMDTSPTLVTPTLGVATGTRLGLGQAADATALIGLTGHGDSSKFNLDDTTSYVQYAFYESTVKKAAISYAGSTSSGFIGGAGALAIGTLTTAPTVLFTNSVARLTIDSSGNTAITGTVTAPGLTVTSILTANSSGVQFAQGTVTLANGDNNNVALPSNVNIVTAVGPSGAYAVTGFGNAVNGRAIIIYFNVAQTLTLKHDSASSTAGQRLTLPAGTDITFGANKLVRCIFVYDQSVGAGVGYWVLYSMTDGTLTSAGNITALGTIASGVWQGTPIANAYIANTAVGNLSGTNTGDQNLFSTIAISGQSNVVADSTSDTLTIVAGSNITLTTDASTDTITIAASAGGIAWTEVTGTSQTAAVNNGYVLNNAGLVTLTLPTTAAVGNIVSVVGKGAGGWRIAQSSGQQIHFGNQDTTSGAGGRLDSVNKYDSIELICTVANNEFTVCSSIGNITVT